MEHRLRWGAFVSCSLFLFAGLVAPPSTGSSPALDWETLSTWDVVHTDSSTVGGCEGASQNEVRFTFSKAEMAGMRALADATGDRVVVEKTLTLGSSNNTACTLVVHDKTEQAWRCQAGGEDIEFNPPTEGLPSPLPDDLAAECAKDDQYSEEPDIIFEDDSFNVEGRYRIDACCYDWWLTYQRSTMAFVSSSDDATHGSGGFKCDGNGHHAFIATECDLRDYEPGPAEEVGYYSRGKYYQPPGTFNFVKKVGVWGYPEGESACTFPALFGVYPWPNNPSKHVQTCRGWVNPEP